SIPDARLQHTHIRQAPQCLSHRGAADTKPLAQLVLAGNFLADRPRTRVDQAPEFFADLGDERCLANRAADRRAKLPGCLPKAGCPMLTHVASPQNAYSCGMIV